MYTGTLSPSEWQPSAPSKLWTYSYPAPVVFTASLLVPKDGAPAVGGFVVIVGGAHFGILPGAVTMGGLPCVVVDATAQAPNVTLSWNDTTLLCRAPPYSPSAVSTTTLMVEQDGQSSAAVPFAYDGPVVSSVVPPTFPTASSARALGFTLAVHGVNFGVAPVIGGYVPQGVHRVRLGAHRTCTVSQWVSDALLLCSPEGDFPAGWMQLSVSIGEGTPSPVAHAAAVCPNGTYGGSGELCMPCPIGAQCDGGFADPSALPG